MSWQNGCMTQQEIQESVMLCLFCRLLWLFGDRSWSNEFNIWRCLKECILPELRQIHPGHHVWSLGGLCTSRRKIGSMVVLPSSKLRLNMLIIIQPWKLVVHLQWPSFDFVLLFIGVEMVNDVAPSRVPMQVFSKAALGAYLSQHQRCEHSLPFWSWGEDRRLVGSLVEWKLAQHLVGCLIQIYSSIFIPFGSWFFSGQAVSHLEPFMSCRGIWQVVSRCWERLGQIDQSRSLQRIDQSLVHWQDICHICARTQHQVLATTGQMYQSEVKTQPDYMNFLHDERCWGVDCGNKAAVAFHSLLGSVCCTARGHFRHCALNVFDTSLLSAYKSKNRTHNPPWNFPQRIGQPGLSPQMPFNGKSTVFGSGGIQSMQFWIVWDVLEFALFFGFCIYPLVI